jgi:3',5'-cyclic AMP phosphodiesterase CpdA
VRLLAISDLHVRAPGTRAFIQSIPASPSDWLILGGDIGESEDDLRFVLETLSPRFARLVWVPGNHDLWSLPSKPPAPRPTRGVARYESLVSLCRSFAALTPEDAYVRWPGAGVETYVAPLFTLYDYTFRPPDLRSKAEALAWAAERDVVCTDEVLLHPDPHPSIDAWCASRVAVTEARLEALPGGASTVLVGHFPLRQSHAVLPAVPRFTPWCGTVKTDDWHRRFRARAVVFGHLHIRRDFVDDGVPFHEVSLGYPKQFDPTTPERYLRVVLDDEAA